MTPLTFQRYVRVTASASASVQVAVAVRIALVEGAWLLSDTVAVGAEFRTRTLLEVRGALEVTPSLAVTRRAIWSALSPLPAVARLSVAPVAPAMSTPFFVHCRA